MLGLDGPQLLRVGAFVALGAILADTLVEFPVALDAVGGAMLALCAFTAAYVERSGRFAQASAIIGMGCLLTLPLAAGLSEGVVGWILAAAGLACVVYGYRRTVTGE